jgi:ABC-type tungstate transport system substrate-binding protein
VHFTGAAWDSYFTTLTIAAIAAPLTAAVGLATAYLLVRQKFAGKDAFEFSTMLSFAIPGTVIGVAYVMAFNFPPIELTGTGLILIIVFVFRNMPVGVRGGIAAMSQLDRSLDEASIMLGANSATTLRRVILPLMGPAILAALTYSFRARDHLGFGRDLPGVGPLQHGHQLHRRPGGKRRIRHRHRLCHRADRHHAGRHPCPATDHRRRKLRRADRIEAH